MNFIAEEFFKKHFRLKHFGVEVEFGAPENGRKEGRTIHKKIDREYFELIRSGEKTFEYRVADFECQPGDILVLDEWEYEKTDGSRLARCPTGRSIRKRVGYVGQISEFDWLKRPDVQADLEKYGAQIISLLDEE